MVTSGTLVLFGVLALAQISYSQFLDDDAIYLPEVTSDFLEDLGRYLPCLDGNCDPAHEYHTAEVFPDTGTHAEHKTTSPYFNLCVDYLNKKEMLENKYPQLKALKSKLLSHFKPALSAYVHEPERRRDVVLKVLDEVIHILQKLKSVFEKDWPVTSVPDQTIIVPTEEIIAEEELHPGFVGSVRGIPGVHYPNYTEVPITSFSCGDMKYIPGFYADLETGCQVFHVCYEHRRESFLCPVGTTFNQPILACDYWYSSNCSLSPHYFDVNAKKEEPIEIPEKDHIPEKQIEEIITTIIEQEKPSLPHIQVKTEESEFVKTEMEQILKFLPIKAKVVEFPVKSQVSVPTPVIPKVMPLPVLDPKFKISAIPLLKFTKSKAVPIIKAKVATAAVPVVKAKMVAAALPVVKAKVAAAAVPVVKAKMAAAAVPVVKAKVAAAAVPVIKAKVAAAAVPVVKAKVAGVAKAKFAAAAVPIIKTKVAAVPVVKAKVAAAGIAPLYKGKIAKAKVASAAVPLFKAKTAAKVVPLVKVAAIKPVVKAAALGVPVIKAKAVMISPLTKKALALGYMKLLKAKKLALLG